MNETLQVQYLLWL